ncbi:putative NAD-dependent epimerase/dehydratase family protein [Halarchaeum rubridurum]|uniref:Putative NAD-dependent epimerase/dehydratase family protein n=1 Tax=Halarchaeum rubridurum TaxID=489911 RepID=A0A830FX11_9EURY|nr:DUF1611 domain-containing protein [Halarchaeum rubridurum]MBP1953972.1 putative NAD-dependent epimerase/dehydratase family protein [Halarchaeum rubridurum]GGM56300.1 hypothetical protein GCM10009017_03110 [Halarchaeum rubridurum]
MRIAILAHEKFPDGAKTATGVLRYGTHDVVAVLDRDRDGERVADCDASLPDAPIVASLSEVDEPLDALLVGISPIGGGFDESWRPDVRAALERGCDVISGLHYFLEDDDEFRTLAEEHGCELWDVRRPPTDLGVADGVADSVDATVIVTVGTDCSVGKMTTTFELVAAARERGVDAAVVPTGQTGIMAEGWGYPIDRVVSDFAAGAVEELILERGNDHDYLFVEGQASIAHPAYSGVSTAILHGSMADELVLCHATDRERFHGFSQALPTIPDFVDLHESLAAPVGGSEIVAGALNTRTVDDDAAADAAVEEYADALGLPAADPIRQGPDAILDAVL